MTATRFFLACAFIALVHSLSCQTTSQIGDNGSGHCTYACTNDYTASVDFSTVQTQITKDTYQCAISVSGNCDLPSAATSTLQPDNYFTYTITVPTKCGATYQDSFQHDPRDKLKGPTIPFIVFNCISIACISSILLVILTGICYLFVCQDNCCRFLPFIIYLFFCLILFVTIIIGSIYMNDCNSNIVDSSYTFDIYDGINLSTSDAYTPTDSTIKSCDVSTIKLEWLKQTCTCYYYDGTRQPLVTVWEGVSRYYNCQNYHQSTGCGNDSWATLRFAGFIIACIILGLFCFCYCRVICKGSGGGGNVQKYLLIPIQ